MGKVGGNLRHRSKKQKGRKQAETKTKETDEKDSNPAIKTPTEEKEETLWETFKSHPLIQIVPFVLLPYFMYRSAYFLTLEHPEYLKPLGIHLRPALGLTEPRQVLIVGTMSSGTVQVSSDLYDNFRFEIGHETSDASSYFVRDGTVSWFHGIRFLPRPSSIETLYNMCANLTVNMGFHPRMFRPSDRCSDRGMKWSKCWARECLERLDMEWGCAYKGIGDEDGCETPFVRTLHQVRHPVSVIESLIAKFCEDGQLGGRLHPSFVKYFDGMFGNHSFGDYSCIEATSHYVLEYNYAMLNARSLGLIDGMYQIEKSSPCDVARLAGFDNGVLVAYPPNLPKVNKRCDPSSSPNGSAQKPMVSTKHKINKGHVSLTWEDFEGGKHGSERRAGDKNLEQKLRTLTVELGYDPEEKRNGFVE